MKIIFYEEKYAKNLLENIPKTINQQDLNLLATYFYKNNYKNDEIIENIINFCQKVNKNFNKIQSYKIIARALSYAKNHHFRNPDPIIITKKELESIKSIENYKIEKFIFCMLVAAKFYKFNKSINKVKSSKYDRELYSNSTIKEIKRMAGVNFTGNEWKEIKRKLTIQGLISPTILSKNRWAIGFWNESSRPVLILDDLRNPVVYYQEYCGESIIECEKCKVKTKRKSSTHAMCSDCWKEKFREINRENMRKSRQNN